jgi:hypothetical protein
MLASQAAQLGLIGKPQESATKAPLKASGLPSRDDGGGVCGERDGGRSSSRATWTADHLPPRAAGIPRSSRARRNGPQ